jgi:diaminopimelate decarboxylase
MEYSQGKYHIQGVDLLDICDEYGTPVYVYDADKIASQLENLKSAFSGLKLRIKYACKSLTNLSILKLMRKYGAELDVVSIQEARIGLLAGYKPEQIMYTPN